jgi:hypothetical protein
MDYQVTPSVVTCPNVTIDVIVDVMSMTNMSHSSRTL